MQFNGYILRMDEKILTKQIFNNSHKRINNNQQFKTIKEVMQEFRITDEIAPNKCKFRKSI